MASLDTRGTQLCLSWAGERRGGWLRECFPEAQKMSCGDGLLGPMTKLPPRWLSQYETLRLYGPVVIIPKTTGSTPRTVEVDGKTHAIPAKATILVNVTALNTCPEYWGPDALAWRPDRWIVTKEKSADIAEEEIMQPPKGRFVPWASGPRVCPGKKFAQVEFVAVMARLFRNHRVKVVLMEGECEHEVKKRVIDTVEDSKLGMTLRMNHPERVTLAWDTEWRMCNSCCYWESANRNIRYLDVLPLFKQAVNTMMSCTKHVLKFVSRYPFPCCHSSAHSIFEALFLWGWRRPVWDVETSIELGCKTSRHLSIVKTSRQLLIKQITHGRLYSILSESISHPYLLTIPQVPESSNPFQPGTWRGATAGFSLP